MIRISDVKFDCRHFKGHIPCKPNKDFGYTCPDCPSYEPVSKKILIIKLGAAGDVIRSTPLLKRYRKMYPSCHISWITQSSEVLPKSMVDAIYPFDFKCAFPLTYQEFDIAINLDKDIEACSLLMDIKAKEKFGFGLKDGHSYPINSLAEQKYITGIFDSVSRENKLNYMEEIFSICGLKFEGEEYCMDVNSDSDKWENLHQFAKGKKIIGLNAGCGERWLTRLWPEKYWIELIKRLKKDGYFPILLGGPYEDKQNKKYAKATRTYYPGTFPLQDFFSLTAQCDVVVTAVTMMMHVAIALKIPLVLFNNIFNANEFYLYKRGVIVQPSSGCDCYYGNTCKRERHCMNDLSVDAVYKAISQMEKISVR